ncbi:MAG: hypothetical protein CMN76_14425 [Spirochaetaceae bacterium]|nr:hypothetical protein [Spirochaetaceae bacterium]
MTRMEAWRIERFTPGQVKPRAKWVLVELQLPESLGVTSGSLSERIPGGCVLGMAGWYTAMTSDNVDYVSFRQLFFFSGEDLRRFSECRAEAVY